MVDRVTDATDQAFEAALRAFIGAIIAEFTAGFIQLTGKQSDSRDATRLPAALTGQATVISRFFLLPDGQTYSFNTTEDLYFTGAAGVYGSAQLTVSVDGSSLTANVSGTYRELTGVIGAAGATDSTLGKLRTFLPKNSRISFGVNAGVQLVVLQFVRPS